MQPILASDWSTYLLDAQRVVYDSILKDFRHSSHEEHYEDGESQKDKLTVEDMRLLSLRTPYVNIPRWIEEWDTDSYGVGGFPARSVMILGGDGALGTALSVQFAKDEANDRSSHWSITQLTSPEFTHGAIGGNDWYDRQLSYLQSRPYAQVMRSVDALVILPGVLEAVTEPALAWLLRWSALATMKLYVAAWNKDAHPSFEPLKKEPWVSAPATVPVGAPVWMFTEAELRQLVFSAGWKLEKRAIAANIMYDPSEEPENMLMNDKACLNFEFSR